MGDRAGWDVWLAAAGARGVDPGRGLPLDTSLTAFRIAAEGGGIALGRSSLAAGIWRRGAPSPPFP